MNESKKFTSNAEWPADAGVEGNITADSHQTRELAQGVCENLCKNGFGGDRKIFPLRAWVEPHQSCYDILSDGRPIAIMWADSPEEAITSFREAYKIMPKLDYIPAVLGELTAAPRLQEEP